MQDMITPIVFTPNEEYVIPTCVAILSILRTKKKNMRYKFYIVVSDKFDREYLKFLERVRKLESKFDYQVIQIHSIDYDRQKITSCHLTSSAYYRMALADVLMDYDKCIYNDGDIIVCDDLQEMFHVNLDNYYVAGVKEAGWLQKKEANLAITRKCGFPFLDDYICSGNLVINLAQMRSDGIQEEFKKQMNKGYRSEDQDVINVCCYKKKYILPPKFGIMNRWLYNNALSEMQNQVYSLKEINEAKQSPVVIHFAGMQVKPWSNLRTAYGEQWWKYAKEILTELEYAEWYQRAEKATIKRDWSYLKRELAAHKSILIFGYGKAGKELFGVLKRWGYSVECFIDSDSAKQKNCHEGCRVLSVEDALQEFQESVVVNSVQGFSTEIRNQLVMKGVDPNKIIDFNFKSEVYYLALAPEWREYEFKDICVKEFGWNVDA